MRGRQNDSLEIGPESRYAFPGIFNFTAGILLKIFLTIYFLLKTIKLPRIEKCYLLTLFFPFESACFPDPIYKNLSMLKSANSVRWTKTELSEPSSKLFFGGKPPCRLLKYFHFGESKPNGWTELVSRIQDFGNHKLWKIMVHKLWSINYGKFRYRWLTLHYSKSTDELSPLLPALMTNVYVSSITKFSKSHKYDVFCSIKQKLGWIMHMSHKYDSFRRYYEIGI